MLKQSKLFIDAIKSDLRDIKARVYINNIEYDDEYLMSIDAQLASITGTEFEIGSAITDSATIVFSELIETIAPLDKVVIEIGAVRGAFPDELKKLLNMKVGSARVGARINNWNPESEIEWVQLGEFYISDHVNIDYNEKKTTITCKDKMIFLEDEFESQLTYPNYIDNVVLEIANQAGVEIDTLNVESLPPVEIIEPIGYSRREALSKIAQIAVGFVTFNRQGRLQIRALENADYEISMREYYSKGLTKTGIRYRVGGISCNVENGDVNETLHAGQRLGPQINIENNLVTQEILDEMYEKLKKVDYYPFNLEWRGNPALEAGDLITVKDDSGNDILVANLDYRLTYNGGLSATSTAETKSRADITPSGRKPLQQKIADTNRRIKTESKLLEDAFKDAQSKITGNQGGYIITRLNEDNKPYEFLVMDTEDINSASNVIRLNQQGIGFSQNGYNGPFGVAITIDGQIVADYITAGTLNAELIQTGFNKIAAGVSITGNGVKSVDASGEYSVLEKGGVRFYTKEDDWTGSIETSYGSSARGVGVFVNEGYRHAVIRLREGESNLAIYGVPETDDRFTLFQNMNANNRRIDGALRVTLDSGNSSVITGMFVSGSSDRLWLQGWGGVVIGDRTPSDGTSLLNQAEFTRNGHSFYRKLDMKSNNIEAINALRLKNNSEIYENAGRLILEGFESIGIAAGGQYILAGSYNSSQDRTYLTAYAPLNMNNGGITNLNNIDFNSNSYLGGTSQGGVAVASPQRVVLGIGTGQSWDNYISLTPNNLDVYQNIDMNGWSIQNQSDVRLKKKIVPSEVNALQEIKRLEFIDFEWDETKQASVNKPKGKQFGFKAQYSPFLQEKTEGSDNYLRINQNKQVNLNSKAIQELIEKVEELEGKLIGAK